MNRSQTRNSFLVVILMILLVGTFGLALRFARQQPLQGAERNRTVQAEQPITQAADEPTSTARQVMVGTPEFYGEPVRDRYRYRNGFENRADLSGPFTLYLIDNETGEEVRLGDDSRGATLGTLDEEYLLWFFGEEFHVYELATGMDVILAKLGGRLSFPQRGGDWVAFGEYNGGGAKVATLYAGNIQTREVITLTETLWARDAMVNGYFGISSSLVSWYDPPDEIVVYDLQNHCELTRVTNLFRAFNAEQGEIYGVSAGETVVTWNRFYGYDLVTQSYFTMGRVTPLDNDEPFVTMSRIHEENRMLSWSFTYDDGTLRHVRAPLLDATPSTEPCIDGQNLVQNGDLEATIEHTLWQQTDSPSNLIVDELPAGLATSGDWAIRLGRYANSHAAIRQQIEIPSGVSGLTLAFDVRALSWDFWGGDRLQVDLIDPMTGNSLLATPVQWTNVELASGDWLPMQVAIESWPGINTPVELVFQVQTDWALPTDFVIDNITLTTACTED